MRALFAVLACALFLAVFTGPAPAESPEVKEAPGDAFIEGAIVVKGEGTAPAVAVGAGQKRVMALRAAKVTALREATEIINGVRVSGETTVLNASVRSDDVRAAVEGAVKWARVVKEEYDPIGETAVVYVSVPLSGPEGLIAKLLPMVGDMVPGRAYSEPGEAAPLFFDSLIVDCRNVSLKPAVANRVVTRGGEVIYDPVRVKGEVLSERGGAAYTDSVDKAVALLRDMGSTNPLVVEAVGVQDGTDAVIGAGDARKAFSSNLDRGFLQEARVVFILR